MSACDLDNLITISTSEVLETMFFTCVLGEGEPVAEDFVSTRLNFRGAPSGSFGVALPRSTSKQLAAGFLAKDEDEITGADADEVVCELTNMLCGSLLSRLESESSFDLSHPELAPFPANQSYSHNFELDCGNLSVWLNLNDTP